MARRNLHAAPVVSPARSDRHRESASCIHSVCNSIARLGPPNCAGDERTPAQDWRDVIESKSAAVVRLCAAVFLLCQCSDSTPSTSNDGGGGEDAQAGMSGTEGGAPSSSGGSGGNPTTGGKPTAGGTSPNGGTDAAGTDSGGSGAAGQGQAGEGTSGVGVGGEGGSGFDTKFMLGADISSLPESVDDGTTFLDTDGVEKPLIPLLGNHGFNYV